MKKIEITESAYVVGTDLARVLGARALLGEITPKNSTSYISEDDYRMVMSILYKWIDEIFSQIKLIDDVRKH